MFFKKITRREAIEKHIETHIGSIHRVFDEIVSPDFHLDIYWVKTTMYSQQVNMLITSGMSEFRMNVPEGMLGFQYAELCIMLPEHWKLDEDDLKNEKNYWPIRVLKDAARYPYHRNTWIGLQHTIRQEDNQPYSDDVHFCASLVFVPMGVPETFYSLSYQRSTIHFYSMIPLYPEEMLYKIEHGTDALLHLFQHHHLTDIVDTHRVNTCG